MEDVELISVLSEPIKEEIRYHVFVPFFSKSTILRRMCYDNEATMLKAAAAIITEYIAQDDVLFSEGNSTQMVWCIEEGTMSYSCAKRDVNHCGDKDEQFLETTVSAGTWISEPAFWFPWIHRGQLRAFSECRLMELNIETFGQLVSESFESWRTCSAFAAKVLGSLNGPAGMEVTDISLSAQSEVDGAKTGWAKSQLSRSRVGPAS